jgi:hypothetical protein
LDKKQEKTQTKENARNEKNIVLVLSIVLLRSEKAFCLCFIGLGSFISNHF